MPWIWIQRDGVMIGPDGVDFCHGYSGLPPHVNDPEANGMVGIGPIPRGVYTIGDPEFTEEGETSPHGPYVMRMHPDKATREAILKLGRNPDSFLEHGDNRAGTASHGCLIPLIETDEARAARMVRLKLTVKPPLLSGNVLRRQHWTLTAKWKDKGLIVVRDRAEADKLKPVPGSLVS